MIDGHTFREQHYRTLGGRVRGPVSGSVYSQHRGHIDDRTAAGLTHVGQHRTGKQPEPANVDVENLIPLRLGDLFRGAGVKNSGVVDQYTDSAEGLTVSSITCSIPARFETSAATASAEPRASRATSSMRSLRRPTRTTWASSRTRASAQARPIPLPAPVTMTTLFFNRELIGRWTLNAGKYSCAPSPYAGSHVFDPRLRIDAVAHRFREPRAQPADDARPRPPRQK